MQRYLEAARRLFPYFVVIGGFALLCSGIAARGDDLVREKVALPQSEIALVDLGQVLKEANHFTTAMTLMKLSVNDADKKLSSERADIAELEKETGKLKAGTAEFDEATDKLIRRKADFNTKTSLEKNRLLKEETAIYATMQKIISDEIRVYSEEHGLRLVLRSNVDIAPAANTTREEVARALGKAVLYQKGLDITDEIIKRVNGRKNDEKKPDEKPADEPKKRD